MKVKAGIKPICQDCKLVLRANKSGKKYLRVICKRYPKHKQRQG